MLQRNLHLKFAYPYVVSYIIGIDYIDHLLLRCHRPVANQELPACHGQEEALTLIDAPFSDGLWPPFLLPGSRQGSTSDWPRLAAGYPFLLHRGQS